jgi:GTP-binding protein HflX
MTDFIVTGAEIETTYLVGAQVHGSYPLLSVSDSLDELELLAKTAGLEVLGRASQNIKSINPATFIGSGKVVEIMDELVMLDAKSVIFDDELSPRHQRELEKRFGEVKVLDRSALILDIFAQHAKTREGALQVELAQYEYRLPRLTRQWTHLARQAGGGGSRSGNAGVGLRGPGETQLEVDRREIGRKISKLKQDLSRVRTHRRQHRNQRERIGTPVIALVGYTNAGKSTLLNALTSSDVYVADQLFATLDPTTRKLDLPSGRQTLLTDTVGFIQKLPTTLIAAFRATLEEITEAELVLHVVDISHPNVLQHIETVEDTLAEIELPPVPRILVWNKIDKWTGDQPPEISNISDGYVAEVMVSAAQHLGLDMLIQTLEKTLTQHSHTVRLLMPYDRGDLVSRLFDSATVEHQEHTNDGIILTVQMPAALEDQFNKYQIVE